MAITFVRLDDRGRDRAELVEFLTGHEFPFHATRRLARAVVEGWIDDGRFGDVDHASYWIDADARRIGLVVLDDLTDDAPLFDLRLATEHRGKGLGGEVLKALSTHVFSTMPAVNRFEGITREDNVAMRRTFLRAGFVQEAYYREGWPVEGGSAPASVAYSLLRRDWQTGRTTPVVWNDLAPSLGSSNAPSDKTAAVRDHRRVPFDLDGYVERVRTRPCFVCRIASETGPQVEQIVYRDEQHIAFLPSDHVLLGYVLVAPIEHREAVADDFTTAEYLALQAVVHRIARGLTSAVPTERVYVASLGSQQGNAHVHWHVAALPPNVPYEEQQFRSLMAETRGVLALSDADRHELAAKIRASIATVDN